MLFAEGVMMDDLMPVKWIERLFSRFQAIYGNRTQTMWGDCPRADIIDAWRHGLRNIQPDAIRDALDAVAIIHPTWPPTLGEFVKLCKPDAAPAYHKEFVMLPHEKRGPIPESVQKHIDLFLGRTNG